MLQNGFKIWRYVINSKNKRIWLIECTYFTYLKNCSSIINIWWWKWQWIWIKCERNIKYLDVYIVGRTCYWCTFCCNPMVNQTTSGKLTRYQRHWNSCMQLILQLYLVCIWMHIFVVVLDNISVSIALFVHSRIMDIDYSLIIQFIHDKYRLRRCCFHGLLLQQRCPDGVSYFLSASL